MTTAAATDRPEMLGHVRQAVRAMLEDSSVYADAPPERRRALAQKMVDVSMMAAKLLAEDRRLTEDVARRAAARARSRPPALATAQSAGDQLGMQAVQAAAGSLASVRDSINFPTYVQSLITGVFQAILSSSTQQVGAIGELLDGVSASAEEFDTTISDEEVMRWAVAKFPSLLMAGSEGTIVARPGIELADHTTTLRAGLSAGEDEVSGIDSGDIEGTLLPLVKRKMGRDKQSVLASMVQMGLQRIVVDEGRIHASMDLRVDATSGSQQDTAQRDDWRVNAGAAGSFGYGPWSASASASTSVGQVKSDHQYTNEQIGIRAGLRSSVDLAFRTEQVPLDRMADARARVRIDNNARVPTDVSGGQSILPTAPAPSNFGPLPMDNIPPPPTITSAPPPNRGGPGTVTDQNEADRARGALNAGQPNAPGGAPPPAGTPPAPGGAPPPAGTPPARGGAPPPAGTPPAPGGTPPPAGTPPAPGGAPPPAGTPPAPGGTPPPAGTPPAPGGTPPPAGSPPPAPRAAPPPAPTSGTTTQTPRRS